VGKVNLLVFCALISITLVISACGANQQQAGRAGNLEETAPPEPPAEFESLQNPYKGDRKAITKGEVIYEANCASCHGLAGKGDGPAGAALEPKPADLVTKQSERGDGYLYWRISEGGMMEPFESMMPAWRGLLREEQIWQVVAYLRTLDELD
jgi:mono/diheme cytochrome c family protein